MTNKITEVWYNWFQYSIPDRDYQGNTIIIAGEDYSKAKVGEKGVKEISSFEDGYLEIFYEDGHKE